MLDINLAMGQRAMTFPSRNRCETEMIHATWRYHSTQLFIPKCLKSCRHTQIIQFVTSSCQNISPFIRTRWSRYQKSPFPQNVEDEWIHSAKAASIRFGRINNRFMWWYPSRRWWRTRTLQRTCGWFGLRTMLWLLWNLFVITTVRAIWIFGLIVIVLLILWPITPTTIVTPVPVFIIRARANQTLAWQDPRHQALPWVESQLQKILRIPKSPSPEKCLWPLVASAWNWSTQPWLLQHWGVNVSPMATMQTFGEARKHLVHLQSPLRTMTSQAISQSLWVYWSACWQHISVATTLSILQTNQFPSHTSATFLMSHPKLKHLNLVPLNSSATAEHTVERIERVLEHLAPLPIQVARSELRLRLKIRRWMFQKENDIHNTNRPPRLTESHLTTRSQATHFHRVAQRVGCTRGPPECLGPRTKTGQNSINCT